MSLIIDFQNNLTFNNPFINNRSYRPQALFNNSNLFNNSFNDYENEYYIEKIKEKIKKIKKEDKNFSKFKMDEEDLINLYNEKKYKTNIKKCISIEENYHLGLMNLYLTKYNNALDRFLICENECNKQNDERINDIKVLVADCFYKLSKTGNFSTNLNLTIIAERYYLELYKCNYPDINFRLGHLYLSKQNTASGLKYLNEGIEKNCPLCCIRLAKYYITYHLQNKQEIIEELFIKAIDIGYDMANYLLAEYYNKNVNKQELARKYYIKATDCKIMEAFYTVADIYAKEQNINMYVKYLYNGVINKSEKCSYELRHINKHLQYGILKYLASDNSISYNPIINTELDFDDKELLNLFKHQLLTIIPNQKINTTHDSDNVNELDNGESTPKRSHHELDTQTIKDTENTELCCICYENYNTEHNITLLKTKCNHIICSDCLDKLETINCPMCRANLL